MLSLFGTRFFRRFTKLKVAEIYNCPKMLCICMFRCAFGQQAIAFGYIIVYTALGNCKYFFNFSAATRLKNNEIRALT